ncbi:MAG: hypothetical protein KJ066_01430 [Acidobacteria bacterium]|nr:hypothetical protein [Acidobacteriota bacterium]
MRATAIVVCLGVVFSFGPARAEKGTLGAATAQSDRDRKPSLAVRTSPAVSFAPSRIYATGELRGTDVDQFYCASVEWDWGDGTTSENSYDCEPFEAGKSEVRRRFVAEHLYSQGGRYRVQLRLKRAGKVLLSAQSTVQVRPGVRDQYGFPDARTETHD